MTKFGLGFGERWPGSDAPYKYWQIVVLYNGQRLLGIWMRPLTAWLVLGH